MQLHTVREVIEGSDFEESEDDFEGYLDMDSGDDACDEEQQVDCEEQEAVVDIRMSERDDESSKKLEPIPSYTLQPGCSEFVEGENLLDYFSLLFTDKILQHIVEHTKLVCHTYIETHELAPHSRVRQWSKCFHDVIELRRFLAILIIIGLVRYPQLEHHWSTQWPYSNVHFSSVSHPNFCRYTCTDFLSTLRLESCMEY